MSQLVVGSRGSRLALVQTNHIIDLVSSEHSDLKITLKKIHTEGDQRLEATLPAIGGKGVFIKEIETALLDGAIDFAVHSLKDMPTDVTQGLQIVAVPKRADARDALISLGNSTLAELPNGASIGTGSPRRASQLLAYRPDLDIMPIRGNVETRIRKLHEGHYDAIVLAAAGLERLGLLDQVSEYIEKEIMIPAVGQGALAIECRAGDSTTMQFLRFLNDPISACCVHAERAFLHAMGGGCSAPITAYGELRDSKINLRGIVAMPDGKRLLRAEITGVPENAAEIGIELAQQLLANGADQIVKSIRHEA